jgi:hypothetical protein
MALDIKSEQLKYAGDVNITDVRIGAPNGTQLDIFNFVVEISLFEDITSPTISGEIVINDALDLPNIFPLIGEERVFISFKTPSFSDESTIVGTYYIYKMSSRQNTAEKALEYTLHFISIEAVRDLNIRFSRGYEGTPTSIVQKIIGDPLYMNSNKAQFIGPSKNAVKYVSNYWSPFQNINFLASRTISPTGATNFVFFESYKGFVFEAVDNMIAKEAIAEYFYDQNNRIPSINKTSSNRNTIEDLKQINNYDIPVAFDYISRIKAGTFRSKAVFHDITSKRYETKILDYNDWYTKHNHLNAYPLKTDSLPVRSTGRIELVNRAYETFLNMKSDRAKEWYLERIMSMSELFAQRMNLEVPGRTDMVVGAVINVTMYKNTPYTEKDNEERITDNLLSGRYLVTKVRHVISRAENKHKMMLEVVKDSFIKNVNDIKTTGYSSAQ